jgi:hypothetical protein
MPGEDEEEDENQKAGADEELDEEEDEDEPVERRRSQEPVGNHAHDRDRLEDGQHQVHDVGIVELIVVRQPAASDEISIDSRGGDYVDDRDECGFQRRRHHGERLSSDVRSLLRVGPGRKLGVEHGEGEFAFLAGFDRDVELDGMPVLLGKGVGLGTDLPCVPATSALQDTDLNRLLLVVPQLDLE